MARGRRGGRCTVSVVCEGAVSPMTSVMLVRLPLTPLLIYAMLLLTLLACVPPWRAGSPGGARRVLSGVAAGARVGVPSDVLHILLHGVLDNVLVVAPVVRLLVLVAS